MAESFRRAYCTRRVVWRARFNRGRSLISSRALIRRQAAQAHRAFPFSFN